MKDLMKYMKRRWKEGCPVLLFFVLCVVSLVLIWAFSWSELGMLGSRNLIVRVFRLCGDAIVLLIPFWFLGRRWRWVIVLEIWVVALWTLVSLCYTRFWHKPLEVYSIFLKSNFDYDLLRAGLSICGLRDLIFLIIPTMVTLVGIIYRKPLSSVRNLGWKDRGIALGVTIVFFMFSQALAIRSIANWMEDSDMRVSLREIFENSYIKLRPADEEVSDNGVVVYLIKAGLNLNSLFQISRTLLPEEKEAIARFNLPVIGSVSLSDSLKRENGGKNLILILVESLNSEVIGLKFGVRELTPCLNDLILQPGTISALEVECQIKEGVSGDGQLLANTGLHPFSRYSTFMLCGDSVQFPSLLRALPGRESVVVFGDDSRTWNERNSFMNMGFKRIIDNRSYQEKVRRQGGDGAAFETALEQIRGMKQPFFAEILTISTHAPFKDPYVKPERLAGWIDGIEGYSPQVLNYFKMINYFDGELKRFLEGLKEMGRYDDSVIVIVSDHSQDYASDSKGEIPMAFIALNSGITRRIQRRVGQVDVYPTILELMGVYGKASWKGGGVSILDERLNATYDKEKGFKGEVHPALKQRMIDAYGVSELILRGNYFQL